MSQPELARLIDAAQGRMLADTLFVNARIVDVLGNRIAPGQVAVKDGVIVGVLFGDREPDCAAGYEAHEVIDCQGRLLCPGFIDGHLHIESSNIRPSEYARLALTRGTTTAIADSHEIANVCGLDGLAFMIEDGKRAPISFKFMMPSCVPALPDEQAGATISAADMLEFIQARPGEVFGLGEMMNLPGVFSADPETVARIEAAKATTSTLVDGHAPLVAGRDLNAYATCGIIADHESTLPEEALDKISRGMYVMLREGTCSHDLENLSPLLLENPMRARRCCFATDDRAPSDALASGMIDNACRVAVEAGIDPILAISMATLSTAECMGLEHGASTLSPLERRGAIAPGHRADMLLLDDLTFTAPPHAVFAAGSLVAREGTFVGEIAPTTKEVERLEALLHSSVKLPQLSRDVFDYEFKPGEAVIDVIPGLAVTKTARPDDDEGLRRIMLLERHGRGVAAQAAGADGERPAGSGLIGKHIGRGWVRGFTISGGAIASSIGHDSHNICVVGDNPDDMLAAVEGVGQGGFVIARDGQVRVRMDLPLGGLMSDGTAEDVAQEHEAFVAEARALGIQEPLDPIMGMIFLPLPVIPELRIRPEGMFDVTTFTYAQ
ncbi:amidohydrolase family protein [Collinsella sp. AGMB00827]|uniref:Adenine deaminase n=1 Tax=Collinsella ureilytica TaxID=2869515 RepID=A0ABS7MIP7_9ACTN|nr:adenine deaminase C-terminal domain-containing protein [Collinsella urealyticum]MBY4797122.1 amidohydrolase family protein [Collinsella urealyticum]